MKLGADQRWTTRRTADTQAALDRGVFGAPSYVIGEEIFWGHDAIDMALDYLKDPDGFRDAQMRAIEALPIGIERRR